MVMMKMAAVLSPPSTPIWSSYPQTGHFRPEEHLNESTPRVLALFVLAQAIYTAQTALPPLLIWLWGGEAAGEAWLAFICAAGAWNGASYYVEIFSKR